MSRDLPLFPSETEIARRVLGPGHVSEWKGLVVILEREGFPQVNTRFGGRYWPACERWFQAAHGLTNMMPGRLGREDGVETCPEPKTRRLASSGARAATVHKLPIGSPKNSS